MKFTISKNVKEVFREKLAARIRQGEKLEVTILDEKFEIVAIGESMDTEDQLVVILQPPTFFKSKVTISYTLKFDKEQ